MAKKHIVQETPEMFRCWFVRPDSAATTDHAGMTRNSADGQARFFPFAPESIECSMDQFPNGYEDMIHFRFEPLVEVELEEVEPGASQDGHDYPLPEDGAVATAKREGDEAATTGVVSDVDADAQTFFLTPDGGEKVGPFVVSDVVTEEATT